MINAIKKINEYWDEKVAPLRRSVVVGSSFLLGLFLVNKIIVIIAVVIIFSQRIIYNANALEKTEKVVKKTLKKLKKEEKI